MHLQQIVEDFDDVVALVGHDLRLQVRAGDSVQLARQDAPRRLLADPGLGLQAELAEVVALVDDARDHRVRLRLVPGRRDERPHDGPSMGVSRDAPPEAAAWHVPERFVAAERRAPLRGRLDVLLRDLVARRQQAVSYTHLTLPTNREV